MLENKHKTEHLTIKRTGVDTHTYTIEAKSEGILLSIEFAGVKSVHFDFEEDGDAISMFLANQSIAKTNEGIARDIILPLMGDGNETT